MGGRVIVLPMTVRDPATAAPSAPERSDFIREIVAADLRSGKHEAVVTRFPPEPNGYLHIGHAKSICLNFGIAAEFGGLCNLRFDDTNPTKEDVEYVESIQEDVRWLGFDWDDRLFYASDYFEELYQYAVQLIKAGKAYVDSLRAEEIRATRGTATGAGQESPYRNRSVEENVDLFARMRAGEFEDLPADVVDIVKYLMVDTLGVIGGAVRAPGITELNRRLSRWEATGSATGLIGKRRYSPPSAALANGAAAHALDFDDMHDPARIHTFCVVLPTLLAAAEDIEDVDGRRFVAALALAAEVHTRLGFTANNCLGKGWHPTTVLGALAAAMGVAKLLDLDADGMLNAMGIAFHQAQGTAQSMHDGVLTKRLGAGLAARNAVTAGFLAADGITGPFRPLEGAAGLFQLFERGEVDPARMWTNAGARPGDVLYLTKPVTVFAEVARCLKPGAPFIVSYSSLMFPTKAVLAWRGSDEAAHVRLVEHYFRAAGGFDGVTTENLSAVGGEPLYASWGMRQD
jgi:hypothetical protein